MMGLLSGLTLQQGAQLRLKAQKVCLGILQGDDCLRKNDLSIKFKIPFGCSAQPQHMISMICCCARHPWA